MGGQDSTQAARKASFVAAFWLRPRGICPIKKVTEGGRKGEICGEIVGNFIDGGVSRGIIGGANRDIGHREHRVAEKLREMGFF